MATVVKVNLKIKQYQAKTEQKLDSALAYMAVELETLAKTLVPKLTGALGASGKHLRTALGKYQVWFNKEYAATREFVKAKHYTTPGTNYHYLKKSLDFIDTKKEKIIKAFMK